MYLIALPSRADEAQFPALRSELVVRADVDQALRAHLDMSGPQVSEAWKNIAIVDQAITARMRQLIARHGWLTRAMVGTDGAGAAWLLVQHAADLAFQKRCLTLIEALPQGEVPGEGRALLTDRILSKEGKRQRFGSQLDGDCRTGYRAQPVEDADGIDVRRAAMQLPPLADYLAFATTLFCAKAPTE